ncbi:MAG TPA: hypothetical protein VLJ41_06390 [Segetibacter sp.]|nr:hypothetical protein [Segetibacter sp.]
MKIRKFNYLLIMLAIALITLSSCVNLYKLETFEKVDDIRIIKSLKNNGKVFIIHAEDTAYQLANYSIKEDTIAGNLLLLSQIQRKYLHPKSKTKNVYDKEDEYEVLNEAHIYVPAKVLFDSATYSSIPISNIRRIDINEKNVQATRRSHVTGKIILVGSLIGGVLLLFGLAVSSMSFSGNILGGG